MELDPSLDRRERTFESSDSVPTVGEPQITRVARKRNRKFTGLLSRPRKRGRDVNTATRPS